VSGGHAVEPDLNARPELPRNPALAGIARGLERLNSVLLSLSKFAMVATAVMLTVAVVARYFFKIPTDWQDDATVFALVGVTFFSCAYVQSFRGHIGIEAVASLLPPMVNAARLFIVDLLSFLFCAFFSWKAWSLCHEAWRDGQTTSSTLAPPLWIPYSMMAAGMTLLALVLLVQLLARMTGGSAHSDPVHATTGKAVS
jgi:TRAP-type C4-dicarboxylate transport system permease small subunit